MQAFRNYVFALAVEQAELATELPIKPWRPYKDQLYSAPEVLAEEWVDCLFFLVDQALVLQLPHDVIRKAFEDKMTKNYKRIKDGYNG
jgi:dimeric dUTPase (all-alpha-NTP-PPase superfamily)